MVVGSRRTPLALPAMLGFESSSVAVGETARLFVFTGSARRTWCSRSTATAGGSSGGRSAPDAPGLSTFRSRPPIGVASASPSPWCATTS